MNEPTNLLALPLLKHLIEMTCHRDRTLLDLSIISSFHQLLGTVQARVLKLSGGHDAFHVRPSARISHGEAVPVFDGDIDAIGEPLSNHPSLSAGIQDRRERIAHQTADRHILWLPVWQGDRIETCFEICSAEPLNDLALDVVLGMLQVYRNFESLLDYSERDSLTGLLNRKTFDENFLRMISSKIQNEGHLPCTAERREQPTLEGQWLAVVDIDHFKNVNDRFGHLYGDEVLLLVAKMLESSFRSHDRVFRFGGEEFVILLRAATLDNAKKVFDRFRLRVEEHCFPQVGEITVSLGFAPITYETPVVILGRADQALYHAKTHGRNQVCHYDDLILRGELSSGISNESVEFF